jgi:hypothetical protein
VCPPAKDLPLAHVTVTVSFSATGIGTCVVLRLKRLFSSGKRGRHNGCWWRCNRFSSCGSHGTEGDDHITAGLVTG